MRRFACMASTVDGKIGPAAVEKFVAITSQNDMEHLKRVRDLADGILFGASTFRAWPKVHVGTHAETSVHHFIMSRSLDLDPGAPLFQDQTVKTTIFTTGSSNSDSQFPDNVDIISIPEGRDQLPRILKEIKALGVEALLVEGGGRVLHQFVQAQKLDELYLTLSPQILGDEDAPKLLGGLPLSPAPQLEILSSRRVDDEVFLHIKLSYGEIA